MPDKPTLHAEDTLLYLRCECLCHRRRGNCHRAVFPAGARQMPACCVTLFDRRVTWVATSAPIDAVSSQRASLRAACRARGLACGDSCILTISSIVLYCK